MQGYIGVEGLEDHVVAIPLERLAAGVRALAARPEVDGARLGAMAISKGSEALLATAAAFPDLPLSALVLLSPSSVTWQAVGGDGAVPGVGSWTLAGEPLPFLAVHEEGLMPQFLRNAVFARAERRRHEPALIHLPRATPPGSRTPASATGPPSPPSSCRCRCSWAPARATSSGPPPPWPVTSLPAAAA